MINNPLHSSLATKFAWPICGFMVIVLWIGGYILIYAAKNSTDREVTNAQSALKTESSAAQ